MAYLSCRLLVILAACGFVSSVLGQQELSNAAIARETSDPTSELWYLYTEFATSFTPGASYWRSNQTTLEFQPSMPVPLTRDLRLLNFPDLVMASQGAPSGSQITGLESFTWMSALSPSPRAGFSWGVGPYVSLPVSTSSQLAASQWQAGPGAVVAWRTEKTVLSAIVKTGWTTSGSGDEAGSMEIQYNAQYFFGDGFQVGLGHPRIEYTWDRDGVGRWDIPAGADVARIFHIGPLPVKIMIEYDFYVVNDNRWEPEHLFRLTILPVLPAPFKGPVFD